MLKAKSTEQMPRFVMNVIVIANDISKIRASI